ncbi:MAG: nucleoside:proton symporter [Oscillatoriales cyanobacterium]|nr:MAG: nucleoside:proton symporter [Oscillatoriales cyanobacterium]
MSIYNFISFLGIFGLCAIAWIFSENRQVRYIPWRVIIWGIGLQLVLGFLVFLFPPTRIALEWFTSLLDVVFMAADTGARFVFGENIVPLPDPAKAPPINLGYIFAFRALPTVIFFSGLMALLENIGVIQIITNFFAKIFYLTMRLSGAEALSGAANIFVGIEAAIVVKPYLAKMTRSELCAILSCCFGTAASSTLAIYVSVLKPVFPNILGHLVSASIIAIPACFVLSKILVPETETPLTMGGIPKEKPKPQGRELVGEEVAENDGYLPKQETVGGEPIERVSPLDAAIIGALDGVKMAVSIAAVLILIVGLVFLIDRILGAETLRKGSGILFYPLTLLTGVPFKDSWIASEIIGQRLYLTAIPPYRMLAEAAAKGLISDRTVLIVSYALSGFAHLASVGIFVGGTIALIPSRRKDISELGWKALFVGTLATMMIACIAGLFDTGDSSILGTKTPPTAPISAPASPKSEASPAASPKPSVAPAIASPKPLPKGEKAAPKALLKKVRYD